MYRRTLLSLLPGLACGLRALPLRAQDAPLVAGIGWVRLGVTDAPRTAQFYGTLFGGALRREAGSNALCLQLGSSLLLLQEAAEARVLEQGLLLQVPAPVLQARLQQQGIRVQEAAAAGVLVRDGDAVQTRLGAAPDWNALQPVATPAASGQALFEPLLIDELALSVTNMQVDSMFYARLLDQTSTVVAGSQYFRLGAHARLRLAQTAVGQPAGFNYFAVLVTATDMAAAAETVFRAGGIIESELPNGFSCWDPEGLRLLVRGTPQVLERPA